MRRLDGIYIKVRRQLRRPEVKRGIAWGSFGLAILGSLIFLITILYPYFGARAKITPATIGETQFNQNTEPTFILDSAGLIKSKKKKSGSGRMRIDGSWIQADLFHNGKKVSIEPEIVSIPEGKDQFEIKIEKRQFKPGKYELQVNLDTKYKDQVITQDFTWGVLALNPDQSVYKPGQTAFIGIGVLDDKGEMICNAKVSLEIIGPSGQKTALSTDNKKIAISKQCQFKGVVNLPDYYTRYKVGEIGEYRMKLKAETENGPRKMEDRFFVEENPEFIVKREGPTRIFPPAKYKMRLTIHPNSNSKGLVREYVPSSFYVAAQKGMRIEKKGNTKILTWQKKFIKGQKKVIEYQFKAPNKSPEFYLLGEIEINVKYKKRELQTIETKIKKEIEDRKPEQTEEDKKENEEPEETSMMETGESRTAEGDQNENRNENGNDQEDEKNDSSENMLEKKTVPREEEKTTKKQIWQEKIKSITWLEGRKWQIAGDAPDTTDLVVTSCDVNDVYNANCYNAISADGGTSFALGKGNHIDAPFQTLGSVETVNSATLYYDSWATLSGTWGIYLKDARDGTTICSTDPAPEDGSETRNSINCNSVTPTQLSNGVWLYIINNDDKGPQSVNLDYVYLYVDYTPGAVTIDIAGTSNGSGTVHWAKNGVAQAETAVISGGNWTISNVAQPSNGDTITVWIDGVADASESTGVTKYSGSGNIGGHGFKYQCSLNW